MTDEPVAVVFVEIPSGSRNKYEYDEELGGIVLDRRLFTAMAYPAARTRPPVSATTRGPTRSCQRPAKIITIANTRIPVEKIACACLPLNP